LAAPELVEAECVDLLDEIEVAAELQQRILADRMMRGEKGSELQACHGGFSPDSYSSALLGTKLRGEPEQGNPRTPRPAHGCRAESSDLPRPGFRTGRNGCHRPTSSQGWAGKIAYLRGNR